MASTTFTGTIRQVGGVYTVTSRKGEVSSKREILVETVEEYPQQLIVELFGERATEFAGVVGQTATAYLKFTVSVSPSTGRRWTNIRCWRLELS